MLSILLDWAFYASVWFISTFNNEPPKNAMPHLPLRSKEMFLLWKLCNIARVSVYAHSTRLYTFIVAVKWNLVTMIYTKQLGFSDRNFLMKVAPAKIFYVYPVRTPRLISSQKP